MVRPRDFGFNEETALDNEFQARPTDSATEINRRANVEFQNMVDRLRGEGVEVMLLEPDDSPARTPVPDAVFPNNWFSTHADGAIVVYPMMAPNRRAEIRVDDLARLLRDNGRLVEKIVRFDLEAPEECFLEGTGALVLDRAGRAAYAARSNRCDPDLFERFLRLRSYNEGILFDAAGSSGKPVYHTNVVMSVGERCAVVCTDSIARPADRERVVQALRRSFEVVEISIEQMQEHFCGNILQLRNRDGEIMTVMSSRAERGFTAKQREQLVRHGRIVAVDLETIESVGGGSARCMLAEVFLKKTQRRAQ